MVMDEEDLATLGLTSAPTVHHTVNLSQTATRKIIRDADQRASERRLQRNNASYDKTPKLIHTKLRHYATPPPTPREALYAIKRPNGNPTSDPTEVISEVTRHFTSELSPPAHTDDSYPWTDPSKPDNFTLPKFAFPSTWAKDSTPPIPPTLIREIITGSKPNTQ